MTKQIYLLGAAALIALLAFVWWYANTPAALVNTGDVPPSDILLGTPRSAPAASAKGVIQLEQPAANAALSSPLQVTGSVYSNQGTLTITLKQKESGVTVAEKTTAIQGESDTIRFAESLLFALPVVPQPGILAVQYKDKSNNGLDDSVTIDVNFPSDLGSGL